MNDSFERGDSGDKRYEWSVWRKYEEFWETINCAQL